MTHPLLDLPTLAPLVARYRARVEEQNREAEARWKQETANTKEAYERALATYERDLAAFEARRQKLPEQSIVLGAPLRPRQSDYSAGHFFPKQPTYQDFLDWCIREGIETEEVA